MRKPNLAHIYEHTEPGKEVTLVGNKNALQDLARALQHASDVGFSTNAFELNGNIRLRSGNYGIKVNNENKETYFKFV